METAVTELAGCLFLMVLGHSLVKAAGLLLVRPLRRRKKRR